MLACVQCVGSHGKVGGVSPGEPIVSVGQLKASFVLGSTLGLDLILPTSPVTSDVF